MSADGNRMNGAMPDSEVDPVLEQALTHFRASVHAWSERGSSKAAYHRPPLRVRAEPHRGWRLATAWAMGCVLVAGSVSGALFERHHREVMAHVAEQARQAQQRRHAAQQQRAADEDLLATVDSDVSRDVPAAMEPLENLMDEGTQQ